MFRFIVGPYEEKNVLFSNEENTFYREQTENNPLSTGSRWTGGSLGLFSRILLIYKGFIDRIKCLNSNPACPHPFSCVYYALQGFGKMAGVGMAVQCALSFVFNLKSIFSPKMIKAILWRKKTLSLAIFLGGFCGLFRGICCVLRNVTGTDGAFHALTAALIAGIAFKQYPNTTIALYLMWRVARIVCNHGIDKGIVPRVPGFNIFLYCVSTAILFHTATVEPARLRPSYWRFLHSISAGRFASFNHGALDVWGLETSKQLAEVLKNSHIRRSI